MVTLGELCEHLKQCYDEILLLELIGISNEDLVDRFEDKIIEHFDEIAVSCGFGEGEFEDEV